MKGPSERLKYDLRRLWECPVCNRRERTPGSLTFHFCSCQMKQTDGQPVAMKLIEDGVQRATPQVATGNERVAASPLEEQTVPVEPLQSELPLDPPPAEPPDAS